MEQVTVLSRSLELLQGSNKMSPGPATTHRLTQYASLLAAQGSLAIAMGFLPSDCIQVSGQDKEQTILLIHPAAHTSTVYILDQCRSAWER